jgi:hypothetical protein
MFDAVRSDTKQNVIPHETGKRRDAPDQTSNERTCDVWQRDAHHAYTPGFRGRRLTGKNPLQRGAQTAMLYPHRMTRAIQGEPASSTQ